MTDEQRLENLRLCIQGAKWMNQGKPGASVECNLEELEKLVNETIDFRRANDCAKLLDSGFTIQIFKNDIGSYTAVACKGDELLYDAQEDDSRITDDFTPAKALYRLTEKVTTGRIA